MVTKAMTPKLGALPDFIDDFNGIFGFMGNITDVMSTIFGVDTGDSSIDDVLNNQELLQEMQAQMQQIQESIKDMTDKEIITQSIEEQILALTKDLSTSITTEFEKIGNILTTYLQAMSGMLKDIYSQTSVIDQKVDKLLAMMTFALKELDYIKDNVVLNSSIVEITPHVQKLVYVNKKFLSLTRGFLQGEDLSIDSMQEIQEWAKSILATEMNSFEFSVDTLHSIIIGDNLYKRSALKTFSDVLLDDADQYGNFGTPLAKFYTFFSSLATLQINAYLCLTFARKVLGLSEIDYQLIMQDRIEQQNQLFVNLIQDKNYSNVLEIKGVYPMPHNNEDGNSFSLQAKKGYALIGLEFFMDNGIYKAKAYQGKIGKNFSVYADTVEEIISDDLSKVFLNNTKDFEQSYKYPLFGELKGEPNTLITRIGFGTKYDESKERQAVAYIDADFSPYEPKSGSISTEGTQTFQIEETKNYTYCYDAWPIGIIGDLYMTPLKSLSLHVDGDSRKNLYMSGESYFSTILSREYNTNFILFPYTNNSSPIVENLIQNGDFEDGDKYWEVSGDTAVIAKGEGIYGSNAISIKNTGDAFEPALKQELNLKPYTKYKLTAYVKSKTNDSQAGLIAIKYTNYMIAFISKTFSTSYKQIELKFRTGADTQNFYVTFEKSNTGYLLLDNIKLHEIPQTDNLIDCGDFGGYDYTTKIDCQYYEPYLWELDGGGSISNGFEEGLFGTDCLKIIKSGGANQKVQLKANTNYILTAYVKVDDPTTTAHIGCGSNQVTCNSTSYTLVKVKFKTGDDPSTTESSVYCSNPNDSGTIWADNFVLCEVPNLIVNGDFEQMDLSSWSLSPSERGTIYIGIGKGISNSNAIVLQDHNGKISQKLPLKPITKYRLTAYVSVTGGGTAQIGYGDDSASCTSNKFQQISTDFTTGADPLQSDDVIYLSTDGCTYTIADNFELYELDQIE